MVVLSLSGCVGNGEIKGTMSGVNAADLVSLEDASGFEFLGQRMLSAEDVSRQYVEVSGLVDGAEGFYQADGVDFYIHAMEFGSSSEAEDFVGQYKATFKPLSSGERFVEESFNGHGATRITTSTTFNGNPVARYHYIWSNEHFVIVVGGNSADPAYISSLAEATGY
ncbi:hypothetical protein [Methanolobus sp. WCC5]|uniref:hypothetical protein n=1 Tax=Methanolobus sp. WCC5 TaxID=3125785 RepID=UPI0032477EEB